MLNWVADQVDLGLAPAIACLAITPDNAAFERMFTSGAEQDSPGNLLFLNGVCGLQAAACA